MAIREEEAEARGSDIPCEGTGVPTAQSPDDKLALSVASRWQVRDGSEYSENYGLFLGSAPKTAAKFWHVFAYFPRMRG